VGVLVERGEQQRLARARHGRAALLERARGEHVDLAPAEPARHVAARRRRGRHPGEREPRVRQRQRKRPGVHDHRDLAGRHLEQVVEAVAEVLELAEHDRRGVGIALLVAGRERRRVRLDPGHRSTLADRCE
jgi:hypothetical protein